MRTTLITLSVLLTHFSLIAQDKPLVQLSLQQAKDHAMQHSFEAKGAAIDIQQADKDIWMATARLMPQVNGEVAFNNFLQIPTTVAPANAFGFPAYLTEFLGGVSQQTGVPINAPPADENATTEFQFGQPYTMDAGVSVSQVLFNGSYLIGLRGAKGLQKLQSTKSKIVGYSVAAAAEENYYTALVAAENAKLLQTNLKNLEKTLFETKALFDNGFAEQMDVEQLDLLVITMRNQISIAERQAEAAKNLLKYTIGMDVDTPIELTDGLETMWQSADPEKLLAQEFKAENNINYNIVKQDVRMHKYLTQLEQAKYLPTLSAHLNYKQQAFGQEFNFFGSEGKWYPMSLWGITLNVPIWDNLGNHASIQKAKLEEQRKRDQLVNVTEGIKLQYKTSKDNYVSAMEQLQNAERGLKLAQSIRATTLVKYNEGISTSMDLTQAENQLTQAQGDYIGKLFAVMEAKQSLNRTFEQ
jgi:outer membrane protein